MYTVLIKNAVVVDGTGKAPFVADIGMTGSHIAALGPDLGRNAENIIDASGLTAFPGFVDIHRHADLVPFLEKPEHEEISQGITTCVSGNCGFSPAPAPAERFAELRSYVEPILGRMQDNLCGRNFSSYLDAVEASAPLACNMGFMVGNAALRIAVAGFDKGPLAKQRIAEVKAGAREAMQAGAMGLSIGLMYVPEMFYSGEELAEIFQIPAEFGRPVAAHIRGDGSMLLESIEEVLAAAETAGTALHISHMKAAGKKNWHILAGQALAMLEQARRQGRDVTYDVYPYTASSTAVHTLLPPETLEGGIPAMLERLANPECRATIEQELGKEQTAWDNLILSAGWDSAVLAGGGAEVQGRSVAAIAAQRGQAADDCALDLLLETGGNLPMVFHSMSDDDMVRFITDPQAMVVSDALYGSGGLPHPRKYGSQARFIGILALERGLLPLEEAVKKTTSLPARRLGIRDRGMVQPGMAADLLLVDLARFRDTATYKNPRSYPTGIEKVFVNGSLVFNHRTGEKKMAGALLRAKQEAT